MISIGPPALAGLAEGQAEPAEELGEVGVDDGLVVRPEAAGRGRARAAVRPGQPPLTCWTPEIADWAVCSAELTDEVPVIAACIAVQMACDTFG
jgi:hypothetical protein